MKRKLLKPTKRVNDNEAFNGVIEERGSYTTLLMEVQIIFAELSPNSFALALCMIYYN